jgi:hypothetical protein
MTEERFPESRRLIADVIDAVGQPDVYLIWSNEHGLWWGRGSCGYVQSFADAGRYSRVEALKICANEIPGTAARLGMLPELPVRLVDVLAFTEVFLKKYPHGGSDWI